MIIDTSMICRETESLSIWKAIIFWKGICHFWQCQSMWVPSQGQHRSSLSKQVKWKAVAPTPSPVSPTLSPAPGAFRQETFWSPILAQFRRKKKTVHSWEEGNAVCLRAQISIQAFRVNLPSLWSLVFFPPTPWKPPSTITFFSPLQGLQSIGFVSATWFKSHIQGSRVVKRKLMPGNVQISKI